MSTTLKPGAPPAPATREAHGGPSRATAAPPSHRIDSIDIVRGAVMVLMAIDHVRVFAGVPPGGPTFGLFFTRWITHFCAPAFIFLAGTAAFLYGRKIGDRTALARWLAIRGAWLVFLELTFLRFAWTFNFDYANYMLAGVIWVIGWCMILLAGLVFLPLAAIAAIGVVIVFGHNLLSPHVPQLMQGIDGSALAPLWQALYFGGAIPIGGDDGSSLIVLYSIVPWIGVMAAGYAFGRLMVAEPPQRRRWCLTIGLSATALFLVLRGFNLYGDPRPWGVPPGPDAPPVQMPALFQFLNTAKYPASLSFLLMTLGPTIALLPLLEQARGAVARWLTVFGRVPFFYYVLHIPLIHALALVVSQIRLGQVHPWLFENHPMGMSRPPDGYPWSLSLLYLVFAIAVVLLYFACRWFAGVKARRKDWWLGYL